MKAAVKQPSFRELVAEAVRVKRELETADTWQGNKLSAERFLAEALAIAGLTEAEARALRDRLPGDTMLQDTWSVVAQTATRWTEPSTWDPHGLNLPIPAQLELIAADIAPRALVAAAAVLAIEMGGPEAFGRAERAGEGAAKAETLRIEMAGLCQAIEATAQLSDFTLVPATGDRERAEGWCQVFVAGTPVTAGPGFGERLVAWCARQGLDGLPEPTTPAKAA